MNLWNSATVANGTNEALLTTNHTPYHVVISESLMVELYALDTRPVYNHITLQTIKH